MIRERSASSEIRHPATRDVASTLGVLTGIGSIGHGLLECLQGYRPTPGPVIYALSPGTSWSAWNQGGEGAFTLIPNFLLTGLVATLVGVLIIFWSVRRLHKPGGPSLFLLLALASFLTGGGVAQVVLFALAWAVATCIRGSLAFWQRLMPLTPTPRSKSSGPGL